MKKKVILFGASKLGTLAYEYLKDKFDIYYFCDNDVNKIGETLHGLEIISIEKLKQLVFEQGFLVVITSHRYTIIGEQLVNEGIDKRNIRVFSNFMDYLQTLEELNQKKKDLVNSSIRHNDIKYMKNIFSKYNVHLIEDRIHTNSTIDLINAYGGKNDLIIIYGRASYLKYTDLSKSDNIEVLDLKDYSVYAKLYTYIYGCSKLFIHFLSDEICDILSEYEVSNFSCKIYWGVWGGDFYDYIDYNIYEKKTYEYIKNRVYYINSLDTYRNQGKLEIRKKIIKEIDYILTVNKYDYELVKNYFDTNAEMVNFAYKIGIEFEELNKIKEKNDLSFKKEIGFDFLFLLGNSSTWSNNHIDAFYKIKKVGLENYGVVLPLSYGRHEYAEDIVREGKKILGDRLVLLKDHLSPYEYHTILNQVDAVIMNHIRQQGNGNILAALYLNKQVYLNSKSNLYLFHLDRNRKVYKIDEMDKNVLISRRKNEANKVQPSVLESMITVNYSEILR